MFSYQNVFDTADQRSLHLLKHFKMFLKLKRLWEEIMFPIPVLQVFENSQIVAINQMIITKDN